MLISGLFNLHIPLIRKANNWSRKYFYSLENSEKEDYIFFSTLIPFYREHREKRDISNLSIIKDYKFTIHYVWKDIRRHIAKIFYDIFLMADKILGGILTFLQIPLFFKNTRRQFYNDKNEFKFSKFFEQVIGHAILGTVMVITSPFNLIRLAYDIIKTPFKIIADFGLWLAYRSAPRFDKLNPSQFTPKRKLSRPNIRDNHNRDIPPAPPTDPNLNNNNITPDPAAGVNIKEPVEEVDIHKPIPAPEDSNRIVQNRRDSLEPIPEF